MTEQLTTSELLLLVDEVTYKPGWSFRLDLPDREDPDKLWASWHFGWLLIDIHTLASPGTAAALGDMIKITHRYRLDRMNSRDDFARFVRECVLTTEGHEAAEWLQFRGDAVFHPHREDRRAGPGVDTRRNGGRGEPVWNGWPPPLRPIDDKQTVELLGLLAGGSSRQEVDMDVIRRALGIGDDEVLTP